MERKVPVWLVMLILLCGLVFMVAFGWAVRGATLGSERAGWAGDVAVEIATFPTTVRRTLRELNESATGRADRYVAVIPAFAANDPALVPMPGAAAADLVGLTLRGRPADLTPGWRILTGMFAIDDGTGAGDAFGLRAVLLSPALEVVRTWALDENFEGTETDPARSMPHGLAVTPDLSLIYNLDGGKALRRLGPCGDMIWERTGPYHHAVSLGTHAGRDVAWSLLTEAEERGTGATSAVAVDLETGETVHRFTMDDIIAANPRTGALEIRRGIDDYGGTQNRRPLPDKWLSDPFHLNDIEPLPAEMLRAFPGFEAGDLLMSARSLDLIFAVDPETLRLRWYSHGPWIRQHDPDWQPDGRITVYDNRMGRDWSAIIAMEPKSRSTNVIVDGEGMRFYSRIRGVHQVLPGGNVLVSAPQQGRVFEASRDGRVVLDILNHSADRQRSYNITSATWLPPEAVEGDGRCPG